MAVSFTSEAAAREGEPQEPPPKLQVQLDELAALSVGEPEFFDLKQPWLYAHAEPDSPGLGADILVGLGEGRRTPNFAPDGPQRPGQTPVRTAVGRHLLTRRKPGVQIPSPPPMPGHERQRR
jgi:hypothetical protein